MKKNSLVALFFVLSACSTAPINLAKDLSPYKFESVHIGDRADKATELLGSPSEVRKDRENSRDELWIYDDAHGSQRGAVSIDPTKKLVTAVTIVPKSEDRESQVDFLLKIKFPFISFDKTPLQRCQRDYFPMQIFYTNIESGLIIIAHSTSGEVESLSRVTPEYIADLLSRIKSCRR